MKYNYMQIFYKLEYHFTIYTACVKYIALKILNPQETKVAFSCQSRVLVGRRSDNDSKNNIDDDQ